MQKSRAKLESNLPHTLQAFFQNTPNSTTLSLSSVLENAHHAALNQAFKGPRLSTIDFQKFDCPESAIVDIVLNGKGIQLQALAKELSFEACLGSPSIKALIASEVIKENQAILVIMRMIDRLAKFFEKETMSSIEEVAWTIYENYGYLSIEDFLLFFDFCKDKRYATDFQHIASKGINPEFLMSWLKAYEIEREATNIELVKVVRDESQPVYLLNENDLVKLNEIPIIRAKMTLDKSLIARLQAEKKERELSQTPEAQLIDFIANNLLWFEDDYCLKTNDERIRVATLRANKLIMEWETDLHTCFDNKEQGVESLDTSSYLRSKTKAFIYENSKALSSKNSYSIIYSNIKKVIQAHNISSGEELIQFFEFKGIRSNEFPDIEYFVIFISQSVNRQFSKQYYDYRKQRLSKEQLPAEKADYQRKIAWRWVVQHCLKMGNLEPVLA